MNITLNTKGLLYAIGWFILLAIIFAPLTSCSEKEYVEPAYVGRTDFKEGATITTTNSKGKVIDGNVKVWLHTTQKFDYNNSGLNLEPQFNSLLRGQLWDWESHSFILRTAGSDGKVFNEPLKVGHYYGFADNGQINGKLRMVTFQFDVYKATADESGITKIIIKFDETKQVSQQDARIRKGSGNL